MTDGISAPDRVRLAEQVVRQADLCVGIGAAHFGERLSGARAHLLGGDPEERADVLIALRALEQELEHGALFVGQSQGRNSLGISSKR
jgi:hypothetical protein